MTHFFADMPIVVTADALGTPQAFVWAGRRERVAHILERWLIDVGWRERRIWREYFALITRSGLLVVIMRDVVRGRWYLERLYD
ncbi:MAG TPA: hypothetical protein VGJ87_21840 [Roseiflexaceae bacterium]